MLSPGAEKVQLHGFEAFEAASWCAAVSAAKRKKAKQEAAARAAAAAAAAAPTGTGSLTPTASCPAALPMTESRPSSSGSSTGGASSSGTSSDGGCELQVPRDTAADVQHDADTSIAPSAFATATAAVTGCPADPHLLMSHASEPTPALSTHPSGTDTHLGMFGLQPGGNSIPHAVLEEPPAPTSTPTAAHGSRSSSSSTRRSSSCPGEHYDRPRSDQAAPRASYSSGLQMAMSVPSGSSLGAARGSRDGGSSQGDREEGAEGDKRGKVSRWLRRVLHLEGPWRGAMPAGVFMGVV